MKLPPAVPQVPVASIDRSVHYYVNSLGFTLDWGDEESGIAGLSREDCRLFLTNPAFRPFEGPIIFWLNLSSRAEIDALFEEWTWREAKFKSRPEAMPWKLYEFTALDLDDNEIRVFYDFRLDE